MLTVTLLGCGGTRPLPHRALSVCAVQYNGAVVLLDCGEGTQVAAQRAGISLVKIGTVLLTHYHGDHLFGLPGLLQTMAGLGRTTPLLLAGPPGLAAVWQAVHQLAGPTPFAVQLHELDGCAGEFQAAGLTVEAFPCEHRVPCCGYALSLRRAPKFDPVKARALGIPPQRWRALQRGETVCGVSPSQVLGPPRRGLRVVYGTDTRPCDALRLAARGADLLCMDATYASDEDLVKAQQYGHATCREAGLLAAQAGTRRLWLTHYSASVEDPAEGLAAAQEKFPEAEAGYDGLTCTLQFDKELL